MKPRLVAIGDLHGCAVALRTLLACVRLRPDDKVVFLGDYLDRGPDSKGVIETVIALRKSSDVIALSGNHEVMALKARESRHALHEWLLCGGDATCDNYNASTLDDIPAEHWKFLASCVPYHETDAHIFVHAGVLPDLPLQDQPDTTLFWDHLDVCPPQHFSGKQVIVGHTPQENGLPKNWGHTVIIDTHAHGGGWLTALDVLSGRFWQANERGESRVDVLLSVDEDDEALF